MIDHEDIDIITKSQIDLELAKMRSMTPEEAAAVAAQAVADAEAAIADAEEAAKEAEAAEADADAAQAFAEAAMKTLKGRSIPRMVRSSEYCLFPPSPPPHYCIGFSLPFMLLKNMPRGFDLAEEYNLILGHIIH